MSYILDNQGEGMRAVYHQLFYHLIWSTYRRIDMIVASNEDTLRKLIRDKIIEKKSEMLGFGCTGDHVHILVRTPPAVSVSDLVREIKGYSSYVMANKIQPENGFRWQGGYGALTVSERDIPWLRRYLAHQKEHHHQGNLSPGWEIFEG